MAKITKNCAKALAQHLTVKNKEAWWAINKELRELGHAVYKKFVPKDVMDIFEKRPEWVSVTGGFYLRQNGWDGEYIDFEPALPEKQTGPYIAPSEKDCERLRKLYDKAEDARKEYGKLRKDIEDAVLLLGTSAKVVEAFPQAADFLNSYFDVKHLPAVVNIDSIRKRLK